MMLLDGKMVSEAFKDAAKKWIEENNLVHKIRLDVIQIGNEAASNTYIRNKQKACDYVGINMVVHHFDYSAQERDVAKLITKLNCDDAVNGIFLQMPVPEHLDVDYLIDCIIPTKDIDGLTIINQGLLAMGDNSGLKPCTPMGVTGLIALYDIDVDGANCVIVGRSNMVGLPLATMLTQKNATVTLCHSHTKNLKEVCKSADILICAIGKPKFFTRDYVKDGAVVVDVGINKDENNKLCGDVDFDDVCDVAGAITPVPGGIGPMTISALIHNCIDAWKTQQGDDCDY